MRQMGIEYRIPWSARRADEVRGEESAVCIQILKQGKKLGLWGAIILEVSKWSEKIGECNWTPNSQENTIPALGLITLTSRLWIVT